MYLPKNCRVITIGDGDLSFSRALLAHVEPENLMASTYDTEDVLRDKYAQNALDDLRNAGVPVQHGIDVTNLQSVNALADHGADIVIFNHPLVPTHRSYAQYQKQRDKSSNLVNRDLLFHFLKHSFDLLLKPDGERLCYITTKSVKPYSHWHIETSLTINTQYYYLGNEPFQLSMFKNYMVRNVDRDKCVKHEASDVYVYSDRINHPVLERLSPFNFTADSCCKLCRKGPFATNDDWAVHQNTRIHKAQVQYHEAWLMHHQNLCSKYG